MHLHPHLTALCAPYRNMEPRNLPTAPDGPQAPAPNTLRLQNKGASPNTRVWVRPKRRTHKDVGVTRGNLCTERQTYRRPSY